MSTISISSSRLWKAEFGSREHTMQLVMLFTIAKMSYSRNLATPHVMQVLAVLYESSTVSP
jgi:hypothetical protein